MSIGAPSSRDPQKDKKLITEIGVLANAEDVKEERKIKGKETAYSLAELLDDKIVVAKEKGTIDQLQNLLDKLMQWKNRLMKSKFYHQGQEVLDKDIMIIGAYRRMLTTLKLPDHIEIPQSGIFDSNEIFLPVGLLGDGRNISILPGSIHWGGKKIECTETNGIITITRKDPKLQQIQLHLGTNGIVSISPIADVLDDFSFVIDVTYLRDGVQGGLSVQRPCSYNANITHSSSPTQQELVQQLLDNSETSEMIEINGVRMPHQGFGGFQLKDAEQDILSAVRNGAKQIDLATGYTDMKTGLPIDEIVKKMKDAGQLNGVYITSKITPSTLPTPVTQKAARQLVQNHIINCGGKIDTLHLHMIRPIYTAEEVKHILDAIQEQVNLGNVGSIGMSNCSLAQLQRALDQGYPIKVIQVEGSPYYRDEALREFCKTNNIIVQVYAPFGGDKDHDQKLMNYDKLNPIDNPLIRDISLKMGKTPHQIILRRLVQQGVVPLAQSTSSIHQKENQDIYDRELTERDMQVINGLQNGTDGSVYTKLYLDEGYFTHDVPRGGNTLGTEEQPGTNENQIDDIDFEETIGDLKFQKADFSVKTAVVSDVESMFEERALHQAEEKLREDYEKLGKLGLFSNRRIGARLMMFLKRDFKRGSYMRSLMRQYAKSGTELLNPEMTAAAERHEKLLREFTTRSEGESNVKPIGEAVEVPEVNQLCKRYLTQVSPAVMTDDKFQTLFDEIIGRNPTLRARVGTMSKYRAGNILLHLRAEREYRSLVAKMERALESYVRSGNRDTYNTEVAVFVREYVAHTKNNVPNNIRFLMNAPENIERTKQWFAHEKGRLTLEAQNYRRKIDLVVGGTGAYAINNGDREQNPLARLGSKLKKSPYGPYLKIAGYAATSITAIATGSWVWPLLYGGTVYVARKVSDATEEQKGAEKRAVRGLDEQNTYYENMRDIRQNTENYKGNIFQKARMKYQARRQVRLFGETTHRGQMTDIHVTMQNLEQSLITGEMLQPRLIDALARIDLYHKTGHNFFAQQNDLKMEETLMQLYSLVQSGAKALHTTPEGLRAHGDYGAQFDDLQKGYNDTLALFKERRTKLGVRHAVGYTATALVMRGLFSRMDIGGMKTMKLNQEVIDSFQLSDADVKHMETWLLSGKKTPEALWTEIKMLKVDTGLMTEGQYNTLKNLYAGAIEGGARGMMEHGDLELLRNAGKSIPASVTDRAHLDAIAFLSKPSIGVALPTDGQLIFDTLQQIQADPSTITTISEDLRRKVGEYVYYFLKVGTDPKAGLLGAHMHEQKNRIPMILGALGLPLFNNTFLKEIKAEKADEIIAPPVRGTTPGTSPVTPGPGPARPVVPLGIVTDPKKHTIDHGVIGEDAVGGYNPSLVDTP